jgi:hypothetical protein
MAVAAENNQSVPGGYEIKNRLFCKIGHGESCRQLDVAV